MSRLRVLRPHVFVLAVLGLFLVLVTLNLNGSSEAALRPGGTDPAVLAGTPRIIRLDEYQLATPLAVSMARQGFPPSGFVGLSDTEQLAVSQGAPSREWLSILRPQDWGFLLLGAHRGLAWRWWFPYGLSLIGLFVLLRTLRVAPWPAAGFAVVGALTPYAAWWTAPAPGLFLGYGCLALAVGLRAFGARRLPVRLALGAAAGYLLADFVLGLYPPWQISIGMVLAGLLVGHVVDTRLALRRAVLPAVAAAVTAGVLLGAWYARHHDAIQATAQTYYPGQRRSPGGGSSWTLLLDAPLNPLLSGPAGETLDPTRTNPSEAASSFFPALLLLLVVVAVPVVQLVRWRRAARRAEGAAAGADPAAVADVGGEPRRGATVVGLAAASAVLLVWALVPLAPSVGAPFLLDRVPGGRLPLALGLAAVLLLALGAPVLRGGSRRARWLFGVAVAGTAAGQVAVVLLALQDFPWQPTDGQRRAAVALVVLTSVLVALLLLGRRVAGLALAGLAVLSVWSFALVNPLVHGLGLLDHDPVVRGLRPYAQAHPGAHVEVYGDRSTMALVRAAGLQVLSGVTYYPDSDVMSRLLPHDRLVWNSYHLYIWRPAPPGTPAKVLPTKTTTRPLVVPPCDPALLRLGISLVVSQKPIPGPCLRPAGTVGHARTKVYLYAVDDGTAVSASRP